MPLRLKDIEAYGAPISFLQPGKADVRVGPCSASPWSKKKIPLDGRHYVCAGVIILKNGVKLRSNFEINTHTFDFLERRTVKCFIDDAWYYMDEPELYEKLGIDMEGALPYKWLPDIPLDYSDVGPYPMKWPDED
ncbi:hypothetical protein ACX0G7_25965 [Flavitalea antarctica]